MKFRILMLFLLISFKSVLSQESTSPLYDSEITRNVSAMGIEGKVFVQFVVDKDGSLTEVQAVKGIGAGCDEEAVRVIQGAPKWKPGKQRGKAVVMPFSIPIVFQVQD